MVECDHGDALCQYYKHYCIMTCVLACRSVTITKSFLFFLVDDDYTSVSQTVTFGGMSTIGAQESVNITIINDNVVELDETILVQGSEASPVASFQPSQTVVNIVDNDSTLWWLICIEGTHCTYLMSKDTL